MAMPQRDNAIEEIKRLDALLEYAVEHGAESSEFAYRESTVSAQGNRDVGTGYRPYRPRL